MIIPTLIADAELFITQENFDAVFFDVYAWIKTVAEQAYNTVITLWNTINKIPDNFKIASLLPASCIIAVGVLISLAIVKVVKSYVPTA